jgi:proteasome assembly chaperone (PAC2) family protein
MEEIIYLEKPELRNPLLIIGLEGWPNAAEISSFVLQHLIQNLKAKRFASIPTEGFYQTTSSRPVAVIKEGRVLELRFPANHFYYVRNPFPKDLILFYGIEPHLQWDRFADLLIDLAQKFEASQIFTIGGTYDYVPHTYPPMVSAVFNRDDLRDKVVQAGLGLTEYTGPTSIHTFILDRARRRGLEAISLWGHAPQYLQTKNVKVAYFVVQKLVDLTGMRIDLSEFERSSRHFDQQVNDLVGQDPKLQEVINKLEEVYSGSESLSPLSEKEGGSKEENVVYIQALLKRQGDEEKPED